MRPNPMHLVGLIATLFAGIGLASCGVTSLADAALCGTLVPLQTSATLKLGNPTYTLATPADAKSGNVSCETSFSLDWYWADTTRAKTDASVPLLYNLSHAFQLDGGAGYFPYTMNPTRNGAYTSFAAWYVSTADHDAGGLGTTVYSITTSITSLNPADSIKVFGEITYYR